MAVYWAYVCFVAVAALCFVRLPLRSAILLVLIGGWWLLPVARYSLAAQNAVSPWWVVGIALPSDMLLTKAWIPPLVAFAGAALRDPQRFGAWRPRPIDLPIAAWCLWPLIDGIGRGADPPSWLAALYVTGAWGLPWLIGRVWLSDADGRLKLTQAIALSGLANLPLAIVESSRPAMLYPLIYGPHPFLTDGVARYFGYRPVGFFEHGNLYGLWSALSAFTAVALLRDPERRGSAWVALTILNVAIALASQSVGAIVLLALGVGLLAMWRWPIFMPLMVGLAIILLLLAAVHFSGLMPVQALGRTPAGQHLIGLMRSIGRGSFLWRFSQDSKTLAAIAAHPLAGTAHWDWFRPFGTRPWGQPLLLMGQFGLVGLVLAWGALLAACGTALVRLRGLGEASLTDPALPLAIMVLLALGDATLNAFFFSPAILAAGVIAASATSAARWSKRA